MPVSLGFDDYPGRYPENIRRLGNMRCFHHLTLLTSLLLTMCLVPAALGQSGPKSTNQTEALEPGAVEAEAMNPRMEELPLQKQTSYCIGLEFGSNLVSDDVEIDLDALFSGIQDGFTKANPQLSQEQIMAVMRRFQLELQQKAEKKMAEAAAENLAKGKEFLDANRSKDGVIETPTGLQYRVLEEGDGDSPVDTDTVRCHYEGTLIDGTVFDSSYKRGQPAEFPLRGVISGWTEVVQLMNVGGKIEVYLAPDLAYGASGSPPVIGPNETLIFTIELLGIVR